MITEQDLEWSRQGLALKRQAEAAEIARYRAWRERTERKLRAQRAALEATAQKAAQNEPPPPTTSGPGWRVLEHPRLSHAILEERAHAIWRFVWHEADWPENWRVRWGACDGILLGLAGAAEICAARSVGEVLGLAVMKDKIILLDEENQQGRPVRDVVKTLVHELCHVNVRTTVHGPQFQRALESAMAFYDGATDAPAPVLARPEPPKGVRFGPSGLDPTLEYRG